MEIIAFLFFWCFIACLIGSIIYFYGWSYQMIKDKTGHSGLPIVILLLFGGVLGLIAGLLLPSNENKKMIL